MSIATCTDCFDLVDTDYRDMYEVGSEYVCEKCLINHPESVAERDFNEGLGLDANPYPYDRDAFSKHQLYAWHMHSLQAGDYWKALTEWRSRYANQNT